MKTIAFSGWLGREYFVFDATPLARVVIRDMRDEIIIIEFELLVTIIIALLGGAGWN